MREFTTAGAEHGQAGGGITKRMRLWIVAVPGLWAALALCGLLLLPQTYAATTSVSVQQSGPMRTGALALLTEGSSSKKYEGILASRLLATTVVRDTGLTQLYPDRSFDEVVDLLQAATTVGERQDLVMIQVALPGPPRWAKDPQGRRRRIGRGCADAANAYAEQLRQYYVTMDNESDSVLRRNAEEELRTTRQRFDEAYEEMSAFARQARFASARPTTAGSPTADAQSVNDTSGDPRGLANALAQTETEIRTTRAADSTEQRLLQGQIGQLTLLPEEDPLLKTARSNYTAALRELRELQVQYGPRHPRVLAAKGRMQIAWQMLQTQSKGILKQVTTQDVHTATTLESLRVRREELLRRVQAAEQKMRRGSVEAARLERLRDEVSLRLEALKMATTEATRLRMSVASGQSRVTVIDPARVPRTGQPGIGRVLLSSLGLAILIALAGGGIERRLRGGSMPRTAVVSMVEEPTEQATRESKVA